VGFDIDQLELAGSIVVSEASDQHHVSSEECVKESSDSSDSETSNDDDDDDDDDSDSSSSSADSFVIDGSAQLTDRDKSDSVGTASCTDDPPLTVSDSLLVTENGATVAAAAAVEPAELVSKQLSTLTVSDEQHVNPVVSELPQLDADLPVQC